MLKRAGLSLSLLFVVGCSASQVDESIPYDTTHAPGAVTVIPDAGDSVSLTRSDDVLRKLALGASKTPTSALSRALKAYPHALVKNLAKAYDKTAGRVYSPACLNGHDGRKAVLVAAVAFLVCYVAWKKLFASKQEEDENEKLNSVFCNASKAGSTKN